MEELACQPPDEFTSHIYSKLVSYTHLYMSTLAYASLSTEFVCLLNSSRLVHPFGGEDRENEKEKYSPLSLSLYSSAGPIDFFLPSG